MPRTKKKIDTSDNIGVSFLYEPLASGEIAIYMIYRLEGKTKRKHTRLFLTGKQRTDKNTKRVAEEMRRTFASTLDLRKANKDEPLDLIGLSKELASNQKNRKLHDNLIRHLLLFKQLRKIELTRPEIIDFENVDVPFCTNFMKYLSECKQENTKDKLLSNNTQAVYIQTLKTIISTARKRRLIYENPFDFIDKVPAVKVKPKPKLTKDELRLLHYTPCSNDEVKRAFLFGCFTGLRIGDLRKLRWGNVCQTVDGTELHYTMEKTDEEIETPLNSDSLLFLDDNRHTPKDVLFQIPPPATLQRILDKWCNDAGITKRITPHTMRHTYASLLVNNGVDFFVASKLLGHSNTKQLQKTYGSVNNQTKRKASELNIFSGHIQSNK